jgi:hypothetical protein
MLGVGRFWCMVLACVRRVCFRPSPPTLSRPAGERG